MASLERAAEIVEEALAPLDNSHAACECCGFKHYTNWDDHQAVQELGALANKLRRWDRKLSTPAPRSDG